MTNPTEPNADAILCRNCGHPRSYHEYTSPFHCRHTDRFIAAGAATQEHECDCVTYYPLGASRSTASFKGKRDSETGELLTLRDTAPAHDVPAAQLRERLAEAERELKETKEIDMTFLVDELKQAEAERDTARADCKLHMESFLTVANAMGTPEAHPQKIANEIAALRAEAADLRARLADEDARWHTLTDGYAGAMRELAEAKEFISAYEAWANDTTVVWGSKFGELVLAFEALRAAQRPEAEGREG